MPVRVEDRDKKGHKFFDQDHILYTIKSRTHKTLLPYVNALTISPKKSHNELKGVIKISFFIL